MQNQNENTKLPQCNGKATKEKNFGEQIATKFAKI
jgi:hypothetical protein